MNGLRQGRLQLDRELHVHVIDGLHDARGHLRAIRIVVRSGGNRQIEPGIIRPDPGHRVGPVSHEIHKRPGGDQPLTVVEVVGDETRRGSGAERVVLSASGIAAHVTGADHEVVQGLRRQSLQDHRVVLLQRQVLLQLSIGTVQSIRHLARGRLIGGPGHGGGGLTGDHVDVRDHRRIVVLHEGGGDHAILQHGHRDGVAHATGVSGPSGEVPAHVSNSGQGDHFRAVVGRLIGRLQDLSTAHRRHGKREGTGARNRAIFNGDGQGVVLEPVHDRRVGRCAGPSGVAHVDTHLGGRHRARVGHDGIPDHVVGGPGEGPVIPNTGDLQEGPGRDGGGNVGNEARGSAHRVSHVGPDAGTRGVQIKPHPLARALLHKNALDLDGLGGIGHKGGAEPKVPVGHGLCNPCRQRPDRIVIRSPGHANLDPGVTGSHSRHRQGRIPHRIDEAPGLDQSRAVVEVIGDEEAVVVHEGHDRQRRLAEDRVGRVTQGDEGLLQPFRVQVVQGREGQTGAGGTYGDRDRAGVQQEVDTVRGATGRGERNGHDRVCRPREVHGQADRSTGFVHPLGGVAEEDLRGSIVIRQGEDVHAGSNQGGVCRRREHDDDGLVGLLKRVVHNGEVHRRSQGPGRDRDRTGSQQAVVQGIDCIAAHGEWDDNVQA